MSYRTQSRKIRWFDSFRIDGQIRTGFKGTALANSKSRKTIFRSYYFNKKKVKINHLRLCLKYGTILRDDQRELDAHVM